MLLQATSRLSALQSSAQVAANGWNEPKEDTAKCLYKIGRNPNVDRPVQKTPEIARSRTVVPKQLSRPKRGALSRQLYHVHQKIFAGISAEEFHRHVIEPPAETTSI